MASCGTATVVTWQCVEIWNRRIHTLLVPDSRGPGAGATQAAGCFSRENQGDCWWPPVQLGWTVRWHDGLSGPAAPAPSQLLVTLLPGGDRLP